MLYIIRGLPGSGKSTFAKSLHCVVHFEADQWFVDSNGIYRFNRDDLKLAHKWCQETVEANLSFGHDVAVSNTFVKRWEIQPYVDMAVKLGHMYLVITCEGKFPNVHNVPDHVVSRMKVQWEPF